MMTRRKSIALSIFGFFAGPKWLIKPKVTVGNFEAFIFPKIGGGAFSRISRVHFELIASELISVQPMSAPTGVIFHMNYVIGRTPQMNAAVVTAKENMEKSRDAWVSHYRATRNNGVKGDEIISARLWRRFRMDDDIFQALSITDVTKISEKALAQLSA